MRPRVLAVVLAAGLAGCGAQTPALRPPGGHGGSPPPRAVAMRATAGQPSPVAVITAFARVYINWTARTVSSQLLMLAQASVGQARSEMALAAAQTRGDTTISSSGIANRGTVEAVAPASGQPNGYVVVTRETTVAAHTAAYQGLAPAWHVTLATVTELATGRWVLSGWQPET